MGRRGLRKKIFVVALALPWTLWLDTDDDFPLFSFTPRGGQSDDQIIVATIFLCITFDCLTLFSKNFIDSHWQLNEQRFCSGDGKRTSSQRDISWGKSCFCKSGPTFMCIAAWEAVFPMRGECYADAWNDVDDFRCGCSAKIYSYCTRKFNQRNYLISTYPVALLKLLQRHWPTSHRHFHGFAHLMEFYDF